MESSDHIDRIFSCVVLEGKHQVRTFNNHVVDPLVSPKLPPIVSVVERLDLSEFDVGKRIKIQGILAEDSIFDAKLVEMGEEDSQMEYGRSEKWHEICKDVVGLVRDRKLDVYGYHQRTPSNVYLEPEYPPVMGVTQHFDLDKFEGQWLKFRAVDARGALWGAELIGPVDNPQRTRKTRVVDANAQAKGLRRQLSSKLESPYVSRSMLLALDDQEHSHYVFEYTLKNISHMCDFMLIYTKTEEGEALDAKQKREERNKTWIAEAEKQGINCEAYSSLQNPKTGLCTEAERINADVLVIAQCASAPQGHVFHKSVYEYCANRCVKASGRHVDIRRVIIPVEEWSE
eukprot:218401_1